MSPEAVGTAIGTALGTGMLLIANFVRMRKAADAALMASDKADKASLKVDKVATEIGADDPGSPRLADTVNLIARNTSQIIETQKNHGDMLKDHAKRIEDLEGCVVEEPKAKKRLKAVR